MVNSVLAKHVQMEDYSSLDFTDLSLKFRVVRDCMIKWKVPVSNADLSNIIDYNTLVECISGKWLTEKQLKTCNDFQQRDPVKDALKTIALPKNVHFIK